MPSHILKIEAEHDLQRLDVVLTQILPDAPSRSFVQKLIEGGHVAVNHKPSKSNYKVSAGDEIKVEIPKNFLTPTDIEPENIPLDIFYEDDFLVVINKRSGMLVHPATGCYTGTLVNALLYHFKKLSNLNTDIRPGIVHRLDQETSGLILVAKDNKTHLALAKQFEAHEVNKRYVALVEGKVEFDQGVVDASIGRHPKHRDKKSVQDNDKAKDAVTFYEVLKRKDKVTLIALFPQSGRTHQLRVHMSHIHHSILGDEKYGKKSTFPRLALHAQSIGFTHPKTKQLIEFCSIVPKEFLDKVR